jgi:fluoroquinolone transport system ATP-binding protein
MQRGEASVAGQDVRTYSRRLFNTIGVSFESPNLYRRLTGLENLQFHASLYDVPTADPLELMRRVNLDDAADRRAGAYSKGMQQRLVFVRSLLNRPALWFLDEPTAGLDPSMTQVVKRVIREERERGATIFLTTHNMVVAEELCDWVAFLNEGRIVATGTPRSLKLTYGQQLVRVEHQADGDGAAAGQGLRQELLSLTEPADQARLQAIIAGGRVQTIHSQEATLEEVFIKVTGRGLQG